MTLVKSSVKGSPISEAENEGNFDHLMARGNHTGQQPINSIAGINAGDNLLMTASERSEVAANTAKVSYPGIEAIQDAVAAMFAAGTHTNASISYDDAAASLSITASGGGGGGTPLTQEQVEDMVGSLTTAGTGINVNYNDAGNVLSISLSGVSFSAADKAKLDGITTIATPASDSLMVVENGAEGWKTFGPGLVLNGGGIDTSIKSDPAGITGAVAVPNVLKMTQAAYDALAVKPAGLVVTT